MVTLLAPTPRLNIHPLLAPLCANAKDTHAALLAEVPAVGLGVHSIVAQFLDVGGRYEDEVFRGGDGAAVEEAHFQARGTIALVDADGFSFRLGASGKFQTNLILHETAVAGAFVGFEISRHGVYACFGEIRYEPGLIKCCCC